MDLDVGAELLLGLRRQAHQHGIGIQPLAGHVGWTTGGLADLQQILEDQLAAIGLRLGGFQGQDLASGEPFALAQAMADAKIDAGEGSA